MKNSIADHGPKVAVAVVLFLVFGCTAAPDQSTTGPAEEFVPQFSQEQPPEIVEMVQAAAAMPTPRTADGHPDLNGMWNIPGLRPDLNAFGDGGVGGQVSSDGQTFSVLFLPPGDDPGSAVVNRRAGDRIEDLPPYKPEFEAQRAEFEADPRRTDPTRYSCLPAGVPRIGWPRQIVQTPGQVVFLYPQSFENPPSSTFRVIPTDGRPHRTDQDASFMGDSVGYWEGDTLVIDVTNFDDSTWLDRNGTLHSEALHVVERITRHGDVIEYTVTVEDPVVLERPWTYTQTRILGSPDDTFPPDLFCIDMDQDHFVE